VNLHLRYSPDIARRVTVSKPVKMAELLFAHGMDPNRPNWFRINSLHEFARHGDVESAAIFLDHGADIEAIDGEYESTPLAWAAMGGQPRMVRYLLRRGARPNPSSGPPWAKPIEWAKRRGHAEIVALLGEAEKTGTVPRWTMDRYEALAHDLANAFAGEPQALARIIEHFRLQRPLTWDRPPLEEQAARLRKAIRARMASDGLTGIDEQTLTVGDARYLIARSEGFADWAALVASARR
jgi:hypothetical protein